MLSTVAVNLRDFPPLASLHRSDLAAEDLAKWESLYKAGGDLEAGRPLAGGASSEYEAAAKIDDRFAELQFRIGRVPGEGRPSGPRRGSDSSWPAIWTSCGSAPTPASTRSSARWPPSRRPPACVLPMPSGPWPRAMRTPDGHGHFGRGPLLRARPLDLRWKLLAGAGRFRPGLRGLAATGRHRARRQAQRSPRGSDARNCWR